MNSGSRSAIYALILTCSTANAVTPASPPLPDGPHAVGTIVWHMIDSSRDDPLTEPTWDRRELMVQAWYPTTDQSSVRAPYVLNRASDNVILSNAIPSASVAPDLGRLPVVMIAPGRGMPRNSYTILAESLASHGFFAVAVDSPHSGRVYFPDGKTVPPSPVYQADPDLIRGPYIKVDAFYQPAAQAGGLDLIFVLNQLEQMDSNDPAGRLDNRLDLDNVGIFAHSLGGRIAGAAVAADNRFRAYISMEGIAPREARRGGLDQVVAILLSDGLYPYAIDNVKELVPNRRNDVFIVRLETFGHNSVTDVPLLEDAYDYDVDAAMAITITLDLARVFFDRYLRDGPQAFDDDIWPALVTIEKFPAP